MTDHAATLALVDAMKARGVRSFSVGDVRVEFAPTVEPLPKSEKAADPDVCGCGHLVSDHINGLCARSDCDPSKCAGMEGAKA